MSPKQVQLFNMGLEADTAKHPYFPISLLVSGARHSGKTLGVCHRVCRHLYETPGARACLMYKNIKGMTQGGVYRDLTEAVIPIWTAANIGFGFTTKDMHGTPGTKRDSTTRTEYFRVSNRYGGESELMLLSLNHDFEVYEVLKQKRFSLIWFSEFSLFHDPKIHRCCIQALRMMHLKPWQHMFLADTNPAEDGEDHWEYKLWYQRRIVDDDASQYIPSLRLMEFFLEDNPFLAPEQIAAFRSMYKDDPGEYAREIEGKWVSGHGTQGKHFADLFLPHVHVVGSAEEGDQIDVLPSTHDLCSGSDIGSSVNHAMVLLEKRIIRVPMSMETPQDKRIATATVFAGRPPERELSIWCVLDELISIGERISIQEFTFEWLEKMRLLEQRWGRKFAWRHYSDDTALNVHRTAGAGLDALEVQIASKGDIRLVGVSKPEGSVRSRVKILRRLLREKRFYVSSRCIYVQAMLLNCEQGSTQKDYVKWNEHKHVFDAVTYPILIETGSELLDEAFRPTAGQQLQNDAVISVAL